MANYTDDFNRADAGTLGANWTDQIAGAGISSNNAVGSDSGSYESVFYNNTFANDQYSEVTLGSLTLATDVWIGVRMSGTGSLNGMFVRLNIVGGDIKLYSEVTGSLTLIGTYTTGVTFNAGDVYRVTVTGQSYAVTLGGTPIAGSPISDGGSTFTSGKAGFITLQSGDRVDAWAGGDAAASSPSALPPKHTFRRGKRTDRRRRAA